MRMTVLAADRKATARSWASSARLVDDALLRRGPSNAMKAAGEGTRTESMLRHLARNISIKSRARVMAKTGLVSRFLDGPAQCLVRIIRHEARGKTSRARPAEAGIL